MEHMRTLSNLYSIALEHYSSVKYYQESGLCALINNLYCKDYITHKEHKILRRSIKRNKPSKWIHSEHYLYRWNTQKEPIFWWPTDNPEHRIKFLTKMITYVDRPWYIKLWDRLK